MKCLVIDNVRSAYNVGAMFRTADGAGVKKVYLVGYTPAPVDRFGRVQPEISKTSLGASESVPWQQVTNRSDLLQQLKDEGYTIVAVEQTPRSRPLNQFIVPEKVAYILGNEIDGVAETFLQGADVIVDIPMRGTKESLNVSVASGIILYYEKQ